MFFRVGLGVQEGFSGDYVVLDVVAVETVEEGGDEQSQLLAVFLSFQEGGGYFLVQQDATGDFLGGELADGLEDGSGAVSVGVVGGGRAEGVGHADGPVVWHNQLL